MEKEKELKVRMKEMSKRMVEKKEEKKEEKCDEKNVKERVIEGRKKWKGEMKMGYKKYIWEGEMENET